MNLVFYKAFYKKYFFLSLLFLSLAIGFFRCVPIDDILAPNIREFSIKEQYNITETIFIDAVLFDNFAIGEVEINIKKVDGNSSLDTTIVINNDSTRARLLNLDRYEVVVIPVNAALGDYVFTFNVSDVVTSKLDTTVNVTTITRNFSVGKDIETPRFLDSDSLSLDITNSSIVFEPTQDRYTTCRLDTLSVVGKATDNVGIKKLGVKFEGIFLDSIGITYDNNPLEIDLGSIFRQNPIIIPAIDDNRVAISNRTLFDMIITVTDTENNSLVRRLSFLVNCDDQSPEIKNIITNLPINNNRIKVIQGQELFLTGGLISDKREVTSTENDGLLKNISIYFNDEDIPFKTWFTNNNIVNLSRFDSIPLAIPIPPNPQTTDNYSFTVEAADSAGNEFARNNFLIDIRPNAPPTVSGVTLHDSNSTNNDAITVSNSPNRPLPVSSNFRFNLKGNIIDDVELQSYEIIWEEDERVISSIREDVTGTDVDFGSNSPEFEIPQNARIGDTYKFTIRAVDTFVGNANAEAIYYFIVQ